MQKGESSSEVKDKLYADLSGTEKYMATMMEVSDAAAKFDAMLFRTVFKNRFEDITSAIRTLNAACDELRTSKKLRKLMAMILTVVNQINTGGEGKMAMGFTLDALLKLNEVRQIGLYGFALALQLMSSLFLSAGESFRQEDQRPSLRDKAREEERRVPLDIQQRPWLGYSS
jgi:hypothetical protein